MSGAKVETSQDQPTQARKVDAAGRELDGWGLPFSGPARLRALAELKKPDPNIDPEAWSSGGAVGSPTPTAPKPPVLTESKTEKKDG